MSDTPRTDSEEHLWNGQEVGFDRMTEFARQLEKELSAANNGVYYWSERCERAEAQVAALYAQIK